MEFILEVDDNCLQLSCMDFINRREFFKVSLSHAYLKIKTNFTQAMYLEISCFGSS